MRAYLIEILRAEAQEEWICTIVLQRDERVWPSERDGARQAVEALKAEGLIAADATLTILEIPKSSSSPERQAVQGLL